MRGRYTFRSRRLFRGETVILALVLLITLAVRLYYIYKFPQAWLSHDEIGYHEMTLQFLEKGFLGYYSDRPSAFVTPGYPLFLAAMYYLSELVHNNPLVTVRTAQAIISVGSVLLVYLMARKAGGIPAGIIAAVLVAIYPTSNMANTRLLTEVLYIFLMLGYMYALIMAFDEPGFIRHAASGALLALAVLVRPMAGPFLVIPYLVHLVFKRDFGIIKYLITAVAAFCLVMSPWWVRNYMVFDKFIPFATQSGNPLLRGTDPYDPYDKEGPSIIENVPEPEMTKVAIQRIKEGFKTEPWLWFKWFTIGKFSFLWGKSWGAYSGWAQTLHLWGFVVLGWLGVLVSLFDQRMRWPALMIVFSALLHQVFIPITRYIYPLTPLMAVMTAVLIVKIAAKILDTVYVNS